MIKYFTYYSFGGYKDMFIGSDKTEADYTYYSPFFNQWEQGLLDIKNNPRLLEQMEQLKELEKITIVTKSNADIMPNGANVFVTHSGFKLACCDLGNGQYTIAIKDLSGDMKDECGRVIPFMLQIIGDNLIEISCIVNHIRTNMDDFEDKMSKLFCYNPVLNCLQCNVGMLNMEIKKILSNKLSQQDYEGEDKFRIKQIVVSEGIELQYVMKEIGMSVYDVKVAYNTCGEIIYKGTETSHITKDEYSSQNTDIVSSILNFIRGCINITTEDKEDMAAIGYHLMKIINRRK